MPSDIGRGAALAALACIVWGTAESAAQASGTSPLEAERTIAEQSAARGAGQAVAAALHSDAVLVWPGAPVVVGSDAVRLLSAQAALDSLTLTLQPLALELSSDSALAASWGLAIATPRTVRGGPRTGRYIGIWTRQRATWRLGAILLSGLVPPRGEGLAPARSTRRPPLASNGPAEPFAAADLRFAQLAGDSGAGIAFERFAAPAAFLLDREGLLVRGPTAIGALVAGPASWKWYPVAGGGSQTGDLGWTVGEAVITPPRSEGAPAYSKYLTVWRRLPDGSIRFLTDGGNPRPRP
jgi:ketosteroid isomerase-like protein